MDRVERRSRGLLKITNIAVEEESSEYGEE